MSHEDTPATYSPPTVQRLAEAITAFEAARATILVHPDNEDDVREAIATVCAEQGLVPPNVRVDGRFTVPGQLLWVAPAASVDQLGWDRQRAAQQAARADHLEPGGPASGPPGPGHAPS
jgi:hypothetical protein